MQPDLILPGCAHAHHLVGSPAAGTTTKLATTAAPVITTKATIAAPATTTKPAGSGAAIYGQYGGSGFTGSTCCSSGRCTISNVCELFSL
jgi:hypothetical protein